MLSKIKKNIHKATTFITTDIWRIRLSDIPKSRYFFIQQLRIIIIAIKGFRENKCQLKASALTFYSLMAIVPVMAMMFGIAKGFGFETMLEGYITERLEGQENVVQIIMGFVHTAIESTKGGVIAGVGVAVLFWSVMQLLGNIERSFNDIWEIKKSRSFLRKFSDYLSIMLISPIFIIISSSLNVYIKTTLNQLSEQVDIVNALSPFLFKMLQFAPYVLIWLLLTIIYMVMPNTNVKFKPALMGGIIAGTIFQLMQFWYIGFQMKISSYNAIYGSFAALPLMLAWLQISWLIILLGAEISFAAQNVNKFEYEKDSLNISQRFKKVLSLLIAIKIIKHFGEGKKPLTSTEISVSLEIPLRIVRRVINDMVECHILSEVITDTYKERAYQPAKDINQLTIKHVNDALEARGINDIKIKQSKELKNIENLLTSLDKQISTSPDNVLLKDL